MLLLLLMMLMLVLLLLLLLLMMMMMLLMLPPPFCRRSLTSGNLPFHFARRTGLPTGPCTVRLRNGDELSGTFRGGLRQGRGSTAGANLLHHGVVLLRGAYRDGVLVGPGSAVLAQGGEPIGGGVAQCGRVLLEGVFNDGYLEGPVRGKEEGSGALVFVGRFERGIPSGTCWVAREGQGWICGKVRKLSSSLF